MSVALTSCQERALQLLDSGRNVFLSGEAGTGKSFLLKHWVDSLEVPYAVTASTGVAALLAGGRTVHSFFGVGKGDEDLHHLLRVRNGTRKQERLRDIQVLIIDEISMLGASLFTKLEAIAKHDRKSTEPWGGLQVVVVGDMNQLPPVNDSFCINSPAWKTSKFKPVLMRTQVRSEDVEFSRLLKKIRYAELDQDVVNFLNERSAVQIDDSWVRVLPRRNEVDIWNRKKLYALGKPTSLINAASYGNDQLVLSLLSAMPVPKDLLISVDAYVMFRVNDPASRFANGTTGYIREIHRDYLAIDLAVDGQPSGEVVKVTRHKFQFKEQDEVLAEVRQFPIQLAWAVTTHKTQGATLQRAAISLLGLWESGQAYTAISRVRRPEHVAILGWEPHSFITDPTVTELYKLLERIG